VPFHLVVPAGVDQTSDRAADRRRPLLLSFRIIHTHASIWNPIPSPGVFVTYLIWAVPRYSGPESTASGAKNAIQVLRLVHLIPYIEAPPPIATQFFLDQYVLSARQHARTFIFGPKLGYVKITTQAPAPLVNTSSQLRSAECQYHVTLEGSLSELSGSVLLQ
jgi:hypothetical protein